MSLPLADLEAARTKLLQQFLSLHFRPGTVSAVPRRCGKPKCRCAQPNGEGHPQLRCCRLSHRFEDYWTDRASAA
jgi:hypothetical protein